MNQAKDLYDRTAIEYDLRSGNPYTERVRAMEASLISGHAGGKVLDAGCGTGYHLRAVRNAQGIDISEEMVELARHTGKKVRVGNVERMKFKDRGFDTVLCMYSVLNVVDWKKGIKELCRVAGDIVISSVASVYDKGYTLSEKKGLRPDRYSKVKKMHVSKNKMVLRLFTKDEIVKEFSRNGFVLVEFDSVFRGVIPHWGLWKKLSLGERFSLFMERFKPVEYGCMYGMVFKRKEQ